LKKTGNRHLEDSDEDEEDCGGPESYLSSRVEDIDTDDYYEGGHRKKQSYISRKSKTYDDDLSGADESDAHSDHHDTMTAAELEEEAAVKPNPRFKNYKNLFENLTKHKSRPTMYPIVNVMISYDSTRAITVTKKDDHECWIKMYDLETYD